MLGGTNHGFHMKLRQSSRSLAAILALCCMLFTQLALASYACPSVAFSFGASAAPGETAHPASGCAGIDIEQPSLCAVEDQDPGQSLDKPANPSVPPFVPVSLAALLAPADGALPPAGAPSSMLARRTGPPLSIRLCCLRN